MQERAFAYRQSTCPQERAAPRIMNLIRGAVLAEMTETGGKGEDPAVRLHGSGLGKRVKGERAETCRRNREDTPCGAFLIDGELYRRTIEMNGPEGLFLRITAERMAQAFCIEVY